MNTSFIFNRFLRGERTRFCIISALWLAGLSVGMMLGITSGQSADQWFYKGLFSEPSLLTVLFSVAFPIVLTVLFLRYRLFGLLVPLVLIYSVIRGFCGMFLFLQLGSGAWLVRTLYLFSGSCTSVLVWWLLLRSTKHCYKKDLHIVAVLAALIVVLDVSFVSPFLHRLSFYF